MTSTSSYTETEWQGEFRAVFAQRVSLPPCPRCNRSGFFGPRKAKDRLYRLCKFCGSYQAVGGQAAQCVATAHNCPQWPIVAGAPYIWWVQPNEAQYRCPSCGDTVEVAAVTIKRPVDDRSHPWWQVPQGMSFDEASKFWVGHGQARVYL